MDITAAVPYQRRQPQNKLFVGIRIALFSMLVVCLVESMAMKRSLRPFIRKLDRPTNRCRRRHFSVQGGGQQYLTGLLATGTRTTTRLNSILADNSIPSSPVPSSTSKPQVPPDICNIWLDDQFPEGRCIGVTLHQVEESNPNALTAEKLSNPEHWAHSVFHPDEISYGLHDTKLSEFWVGRLAMRIALGFPDFSILKDSYGRPTLPPGICGSISHKRNTGVAIAAPIDHTPTNLNSNSTTDVTMAIGIDLEYTSRPRKKNRSIADRVLTDKELQEIGRIPNITEEEEVLLRFSLKEAMYKASHPLLCEFVAFREAEVTPFPDGTAHCVWHLKSGSDKRLSNWTAHWKKLDQSDYFLTTASARLG